jgi:hypothetical protein
MPADPPRPISTEGRAARRRWEAATAARFERAIKLCQSKAIHEAASNFAHRGSVKGRQRALSVLHAAFDPLGTLEGEVLTGARPAVIWSVISASMPMLSQIEGSRELTESEEQLCAAVYYWMFGRCGDSVHVRGVWAMSVTTHCVGRYFDRTATRDDPASLDKAILAAHRALLQAPSRNLKKLLAHRLLIPAGSVGFFLVEASPHRSKETGSNVLHVRALTFFPPEMASDAMIQEGAALLRREGADDPALIGSLLHPLCLRAPAAQAVG